MGKKSKGDRKTKSGRHVEEEDDLMPLPDDHDSEVSNNEGSEKFDKVGREDVQVDLFLDGVENINNKKASARLKALKSILSSLQSGVDLFDRVTNYMDTLIENLSHLLTHRNSNQEALLAMKVVSVMALVAGADNDAFADEFSSILINLATRSAAEDLELRIASVRTLAFIHFVCCEGSNGYSCFGVIGDIALCQSEGTDATPELQIAAADAWCLLAHVVDPQKVCDVSRDEDMFVELVNLLQSPNTETKIMAGQCLAMLWEVADRMKPDEEAAISAQLLCDDDEKIQESLDILKQIGKESSKRVNKKDRKERKSALKSVTDWIVEGTSPQGDVIYLQGAEVESSSFGEIRVVEYLRSVLKGGLQACLRVYPVTRDILGAEYTSFENGNSESVGDEVAGGGGVVCEAFEKRYVRSQVGKIKKTQRQNQRADKEMMQADCF